MTILKEQGIALRGLAILLIVFHNVIHLLCPIKENEFMFYQARLDIYLTNWSESPITHFVSFYGWVGVSVFVFISGYGLMAKYGKVDLRPLRWITKHYLKLVFLLLPALLILYIIDGNRIIGDSWKALAYYYFLEQFLLLNIFNPSLIWPGIYWYLGMALQLYVIFLLIRKLPNKHLLIIGILSCVILAISPTKTVGYLRHNFIGWLPEFIFGMLYFRLKGSGSIHAVQGKSTLIRALCIITLAVTFIVVSWTRYTFFLGGVAFVALILFFKRPMSKLLLFKYLGRISAALYITHAFVRNFWIHASIANELGPLANALLVLCLAIIVAMPYEYYYQHISSKLLRQ